MKLKIVTLPDPALRKKSKPVQRVDKKLIRFIKNLQETLIKAEDPPGVGLSAVQAGKNWRIFLTYLKNKEGKRQFEIFINPVIFQAGKKMTLGPDKNKPFLEGCLSIPQIYAPVKRHQTIKLKYQTLDPNQHQLKEISQPFTDFAARVVQHEIDHLNGILFIDRVKDQSGQLYLQQDDQMLPIDQKTAVT